jgi:hypothetical protein
VDIVWWDHEGPQLGNEGDGPATGAQGPISDEVVSTTFVVVVTKTKREQQQGIVSESRRRLRAQYEAQYPTARIDIRVERVTAETAQFEVRVNH